MRRKKKIVSLLLAGCLIAGSLPINLAMAETDTGKAIMLGTDGITGYDSTNGYDYIYFGSWGETNSKISTGPIKWRVLDTKGNATGKDDSLSDGQKSVENEDALYLLSDMVLGTGITEYDHGGLIYQNDYHDDGDAFYKGSTHDDGITEVYANAWQGSDAQNWCKDFGGQSGSENIVPDAFTDDEISAILETKKSDAAVKYHAQAATDILNGDKIFFMSMEEALNSTYGFTDNSSRAATYGTSTGLWWLRSPRLGLSIAVCGVDIRGVILDEIVYADNMGPRPAFNLNSNDVLFTSAAVGGKASASSNSTNQESKTTSEIFKISDCDTSEWKLTLLDSDREFAITESDVTGGYGEIITLNYNGATVYNQDIAPNEYISVIIADNTGAKYYGRIMQPESVAGQVSVKIPAELAVGEYTLNVFSEQYNGGVNDDTKLTDYASAFETVKLTVTTPAADDNETLDNTDSADDNETFDNKETELTNESVSPQTGDNVNFAFLFVIALTAIFVCVITLFARRRV